MTELARFFEGCISALKWAVALAVVLAAAAVGFVYLQLDEELRQRCEQLLANHYQNLTVHVGSARLVRGKGLALYDVVLAEPSAGKPGEPILTVDELFVNFDAKVEELLTKKPVVRQVLVKRPQLHARWMGAGGWNFQALFPLPRLGRIAPPIQIEDAVLLVYDAAKNANSLAIRDIDIQLTPDRNQAAVANSDQDGSNRAFQLVGVAGSSPARLLRFEGSWNHTTGQMAIVALAEELEVSPELFAALPCFDATRLSDLEVEGRANLTLRLNRPPGPNAKLDWSAEARLSRGRLNHRSLPRPLTDVVIDARCNSNELVIERLAGKCGTTDLVAACQRHGWQPDAPIGIAARATGLVLDEQLFAVLPEPLRPVWLRFQPTGTVDVDVRAMYDGVAWRPEATVACRQMSLTDQEKFPYRVENCTGEITLRPIADTGRAELRLALVGAGQNHSIKIDAQLSEPPATTQPSSGGFPLKGWIEVSGADVPLHDELIAALPDGPERIVRSLHAQGKCDFRWRFDAAAPQPPKTQFNLQLKNCAIQYERFPYPLENISGTIAAENRVWQLRDLVSRGTRGSMQVRCQGQVVPAPTGYELQLTFTGEDLSLDETLKSALSPQVQEAWSELRPQGRIGFTADVRHQTGEPKPRVAVVLRSHDQSVSFEPRMFPYRFDAVEGEVHVADGIVRLAGLRARHGTSAFSTQGFWQPLADGGWELQLQKLEADHLSDGHDLVLALPPGMQKAIDRIDPNGTFRLFDSTLRFIKPGVNTGRLATAWDVHLDCHQSDLRLGIPLEDVSGAIRLTGLNDGQQMYSHGDLQVDSLLWKGHQFTNIRGPLWIDRNEFLLGRPASAKRGQPPQPAMAQIYGGSVVADATVRLAGHPRYALEASLIQADLARLANERLGGQQDMTGTVAGHLALSGAGFSTHALTGEGELHVTDANMYRLPVLVALLKMLQIRAPDTTAFNRCDMQFSLAGEHVHFQQLNFLGDAVSLYGRGEANFNRDLNLVFYSLMGADNMPKPLSMLRSLAGQASEQMLQFKVDGTMDDPQIHREAFPAVAQILEQIQADLQTTTGPNPPQTMASPVSPTSGRAGTLQ